MNNKIMIQIENKKLMKYRSHEYNIGNFCILHRDQKIEDYDPTIAYEAIVVKTIKDKRNNDVDIVKIIKPYTYEKIENNMKLISHNKILKGYKAIYLRKAHIFLSIVNDKLIQKEDIIEDIPESIQKIILQYESLGEKIIGELLGFNSNLNQNIYNYIKSRIDQIISKNTIQFNTEKEAWNYISFNGLDVKPIYHRYVQEIYQETIYDGYYTVDNLSIEEKEKIKQMENILGGVLNE